MTLRRALGAVFVVGAFLFLALFVARDLEQLRAYDWEVRPVPLAASVAMNVAALWIGVAAWRLLLRFLGHEVALRSLARVWFVSGLGRYIPGKVWQFVGAAQLGPASGLPAIVAVTSLAAHTFFFVVAAALVAVYLVPVSALGLDGGAAVALRIAAPLLLLLVHPAAIRTVLRLLRRLTRRELGEWTGSWAAAVAVVAVAVLAWLVSGAAFFLFVASLAPLDPAAAPALIGMNALAFIAGYVVFITPAGLGAKEGALAALLSLYLPLSVAAIVAVAARLWMIAAEVIPALLLLRTPRQTTPPGRPPGP